MRLHILADLHLEFEPVDIPATNADVVVLAGDIDVGRKGLDWIKSRFPDRPVVYVLGNHEFYRNTLPDLTQSLKAETKGGHVHVLENDSIELGDFTFLGCTLWTDFTLAPHPERAMAKAEELLNDYRLVRFSPAQRVLRARDTACIHRASVAWLKAELRRLKPAQTIVVTHHAPSPRSEAPGYVGGPLSPSFVSDLNFMVEQSGIPLWIHGHTHYNIHYQLGPTHVLANQRGYPRETCGGFDPSMVVEI